MKPYRFNLSLLPPPPVDETLLAALHLVDPGGDCASSVILRDARLREFSLESGKLENWKQRDVLESGGSLLQLQYGY